MTEEQQLSRETPRSPGRRGVWFALAIIIGGALLLWWSASRLRSLDDEVDSPESAAVSAGDEAAAAIVAGRVLEHGDIPRGVAGALVSAVCDGDDGRTDWTATANDEGGFWFGVLPEGRCALRARAPGYVTGGPGQGARATVLVHHDEPNHGVVLTLFESAALEGRVLAAGEPLGAVRLTLLYLEAPGAEGPFSVDPSVNSRSDGRFQMENLIPGRLQVLAEHDNYALSESDALLLRAGETRTGFIIHLSGGGDIVGTVFDPQGRGIPDATVRVIAPRSRASWQAETDRGGRFALEEVTPGTVSLSVRANGFEETRNDDVVVVAGELVQLTITLARARGFGGIVLTPDGYPAAHAGVYLRAPGDAPGLRARRQPVAYSDEDGRFWISEIGAGPRLCFATHPAFGPSAEVPVPSDGSEVVLRLAAGGRLVGTVQDSRGAPIGSYVAALQSFRPALGARRPAGPLGRLQAQDPRGEFVFEGLLPGTYDLRISAPGFPVTLVQGLLVVAGEETDVGAIILERGGVIVGSVTDGQTGAPIAGARVRAAGGRMIGVPGRGQQTTTAADGSFAMSGVSPERLSLSVSARGYVTRLTSGILVPSDGEVDAGVISLDPVGPGESRGRMQYSGIGAVLGQGDRGIVIRQTFEGSPSAEWGLEPGTEIQSVDGYPAAGMGLYEVVEMIRGESGTEVSLEVVRPGSSRVETVRIERGAVTTPVE